MHITYDQVTEFEPHQFSAEASELRMKPGEWPAQIETSMGNGLPLIRTSAKLTPSGDLGYVRYRQSCGCLNVIIYND